MNSIEKAKQIIEKYNVPSDLCVDWNGTNHYECTSESEGMKSNSFFWLDVENALKYTDGGGLYFDSTSINGQRLGALLELGALFASFLVNENAK